MPAYTKIARPYAKAAFEYATADNDIADWNLFLQKARMIIEDKRVQAFLQNPKIEKEKKLDFVNKLCQCDKASAKKKLLYILAEHDRFLIIPSLAQLFNELVKQYNNIVDVTVTSAFPFSKEQQHQLREALKIRLGKQVEIKIVEDKTLIGGAVIRAGDFVIDGSIQGKLKRLRKTLVNLD